ncbi:glycoside hydrolase [Bimuria novae-zelandiae CBS 107.79]|uniref:glucan endo-1,3-beta-D-glucosidase n=1 Tax=Bimuria novae-zelandiae CBS 107.79 TaxID=1447943 RepID=A0A6A5VPJ1_9PLEO|nr:glycoside hydrolase [Bimuria novae-zelandiae CBS 107.79]
MRFSSTLVAAAALLSGAEAAYKGFNYGAFFGNQQAKVYADFKYEFEAAKALPGTNSQFTSARLYTMIQHGTKRDVIQAIKAAIDTNTQLLLGLWTSAGQAVVDDEIAALKAAITTYGTKFTNLVVGISVGSEDLYRITPTAIANGEKNPGVQPAQLVKYINQVRTAIKGTGLASKPIGHVDTWTAYNNASNSAVVSALDFLGVDAYPYFEKEHANSIGAANATFYDAYKKTVAAAKGKPVWVTETGWPVSGPKSGQAVASAANARIYWEDVTCSLLRNNVHLFYYTLQDIQYSNPSPSFGIKPGGDLKAVNPLFSLTCPKPLRARLPHTIQPVARHNWIARADVGGHTIIRTSLTQTVTSQSMSTVFVWAPIPTASSSEVVNSPASMPVSTPGSTFPGYPQLDQPGDLTPPFVAPNLVVSIDSSDPNKVIGNSYTAQISPTRSTLIVFDVPPSSPKTCNLVFAVPPAFDPAYIAPMQLTAPGGISVSRLDGPATVRTSASTVVRGTPVGAVLALQSGNKYTVASAPCEAGQKVSYRVDSLDGLDMSFFQMTSPALGLFIEMD